MHTRGRTIIFLGPPGSGKGTQAARLASELDIPAISTGEMLRREGQSKSSLGKPIQAVLASGQLVSDDLINQVIASRLRQSDCEAGCVLDGYPRTVAQARYLDNLLATLGMPAPVVFDFRISAHDVVFRLSRRRQCAECGRTFTVNGGSNKAELVCEYDGSKLIQRTDDHPATIRERLRVYEKNAAALIGYYRTRDYHDVRATRTPAEISEELLSVLGSGEAIHLATAIPASYFQAV